jgi:hypothetical protein
MKANCLMMTLAVGMLAALPAHAGFGLNMGTYASRFRSPAPPTASHAAPQIQVAVLANSQAATGKLGTSDAHPFGPPRAYAVRSH